jgi:hypothetical protein
MVRAMTSMMLEWLLVGLAYAMTAAVVAWERHRRL